MSSPLLADWDCSVTVEGSVDDDGEADGEISGECEYTYGS